MREPVKVYSLVALAAHEKVSYSFVRSVVSMFRSGEIEEWRGYQFFGIDSKVWFAYSKETPIILIHEQRQ